MTDTSREAVEKVCELLNGEISNAGYGEPEEGRKEAIIALRALLARAEKAERERDNAFLQEAVSGTETGAYWKGHDEAVAGVAGRWREALDDPMPKVGVMSEPLEGLYRRTEALRKSLDNIIASMALESSCALKYDTYQVEKDAYDVALAALKKTIREL